MANSTYLRQMHQRRIIQAVARCGEVSRSGLARATGMSQPTVSRIVEQLLSEHVLVESTVADSAAANRSDKPVLGRPSVGLKLDRQRPRFCVMQVGVRFTRLAVLPVAIPGEDRWDDEFPTPGSADEWIRQLARVWEPHAKKGLRVMVSLPGVVDEQSGKAYLSPNLRWLESLDLGAALRDVFGSQPIFKHEIRLLALGQLATEPDAGDFLLVDSGNGVGAAAIINGKLFKGTLPLCGEIGHIAVPGNHRPCGCGATGCLETLVSRGGLLTSAAEHGEPATWPELVKELTGKEIPRWLKHTLENTAVNIAGALNLFGLRNVVLTGAFAELPQSTVDFLSESVQEHSMWARFGQVAVRAARRHRQAGMVSVALEEILSA
ncbi:MAG TPA: ROK family transcriptional regulator [Tepidisphaeraceae bacterium]|nr:ROK family transcriptional regulator [Tepidisphaeraceae bacterium]